jgi:tetratricopeptide (TPR) repeat protein
VKMFLCFLLLMFCILGPGFEVFSDDLTAEVASLFEKASESYLKEDYTSSIEKYKLIIDTGFKSSNVFYNLGNSYMKNGKIALAIINYERALVLMPSDSDVTANLRYARSLLKQADPAGKGHMFLRMLNRLFSGITVTAMICIAALVYCLLIGYVAAAKIFKKAARRANLIITIGAVILGVLILPLKQRLWDLETAAIVTENIIDAKFEPSNSSMTHFPLYEGMKVNVVREHGEWLRVRRPDGKIGWVLSKDISEITPI